MSAAEAQALSYFANRVGAFWRWSEDGQAITWAGGKTIAFRDEVVAVLSRLAPTGLPPFGAIVLLLGACRDGWLDSGSERATVRQYADRLRGTAWSQPWPFSFGAEHTGSRRVWVDQDLQAVFAGLDAVARLRTELRHPTAAKAVIAEMVFETAQKELNPAEAAAAVRQMAGGLSPEAILDVTGRADESKRFGAELAALRIGLPGIDEEKLALRLRTGLEQLVEAADVELPPADRVRQLLGRLRDDTELAGIGAVAERLLAAIHVPRALSTPEELPLGGVSDLSNRGPLDRLLLSELANDDLTLAVRVALSEALYLRRESPASNPRRRRAILLDAGIRTWGTPRVYVAAVGLALAATADLRASLAVYRAAGTTLVEVDLTTRDGLVRHLEALEPAPHVGAAIGAFVDCSTGVPPVTDDALPHGRGSDGALPDGRGSEAIPHGRGADRGHGRDARGTDAEITETIIVTHEDAFADREFSQALRAHDDRDWFIATVARDGTFRLHHASRAGRRQISEARLELEDLLSRRPSGKSATPLLVEGADLSLPVILTMDPLPLLLPHTTKPWFARATRRHGLLATTTDGRLLQWTSELKGARQITGALPQGQAQGIFVDEAESQATIAISQDDSRLLLVCANLPGGRCTTSTTELRRPHALVRYGDVLLAIFRRQIVALSPRTGWVLASLKPFAADLMHLHGRFFRDAMACLWAASFDGSRIRLDRLTSVPAGPDQVSLTAFDREGHDGSWLLLNDGGIVNVLTRVPVCRGRFRGSVEFAGASADGNRVAIEVTIGLFNEVYVVDLLAAAPNWRVATHGAHAELVGDALRYSTKSGISPSRRFKSIFLSAAGELTLCSATRHHAIAADGNGQLCLCDRGPHSAYDAHIPFRSIRPPAGMRFRLAVAAWRDGSRAYLDSRGMLHLKSSDRKIPELTLTLSNVPIAGWTSEGHTFGWSYFLPDKPSVSVPYIQGVIGQFIARLR